MYGSDQDTHLDRSRKRLIHRTDEVAGRDLVDRVILDLAVKDAEHRWPISSHRHQRCLMNLQDRMMLQQRSILCLVFLIQIAVE